MFIRFTNFWWVKFKNCFNDVKEQAFVHMIYSTWALSVKQIFKRGFLKTEMVRIKSYDINSLLEGHRTLNAGLFSNQFRPSFIRLDMYWKLFLN